MWLGPCSCVLTYGVRREEWKTGWMHAFFHVFEMSGRYVMGPNLVVTVKGPNLLALSLALGRCICK
jgi:hypothetical protein